MVSIAVGCFVPNGPEWFANWATGTPAERSERYDRARSLGLVTDREPEFDSTVAPIMFWPPGHQCYALNGGGVPPAAPGALPEPSPVGLGTLDPRRLWEALKNALERILGSAQLALVAAIALAAGLVWLLFGRKRA